MSARLSSLRGLRLTYSIFLLPIVRPRPDFGFLLVLPPPVPPYEESIKQTESKTGQDNDFRPGVVVPKNLCSDNIASRIGNEIQRRNSRFLSVASHICCYKRKQRDKHS